MRTRGAAIAFRALAVIILLNAHWLHLWGMPMVRPAGYLVILVCCLLVFALAGARSWKAPGTAGAWIAATVASWLLIGGAVSLSAADGAHSEAVRTALRQVFFLLVLLAAAVGGRVVLQRVGTEPFLKGVFAILIASCAAVPLSPVLRDLGVLPVYRLPHRLSGVFTHHADAGLLGSMTVVLALALLRADGRRRLAYAGLAAGYGAILASTSRTAAVIFAVVFPFFLAVEGSRRAPASAPLAAGAGAGRPRRLPGRATAEDLVEPPFPQRGVLLARGAGQSRPAARLRRAAGRAGRPGRRRRAELEGVDGPWRRGRASR